MAFKQKSPLVSGFLRLLFSLVLGGLAAASAAAGFAALMASRGLSQPVAWPLATAAACLGALCSGFVLARMQKSNGLLCGGLQGALFSVLLLGATVVSGNAMAGTQWARAALLLFCGCVGGCLGVLRAEKARRTH